MEVDSFTVMSCGKDSRGLKDSHCFDLQVFMSAGHEEDFFKSLSRSNTIILLM